MKKFLSAQFQHPLDIAGLAMIILSAIFLLFSKQFGRQDDISLFFVNYFLSVSYLIAVLIHTVSRYRWHFADGKFRHTVLLLVLWFISAFALNREMNVFDSSVDWLTVWLIIAAVSLLLAVRHSTLPKALQYLIYFLLGTALLLFTYYALYLIPLYAISLIGLLAIGISLHSYIPLFLTIATAVLIIRAGRENKTLVYMAASGFILPLLACAVFLLSWHSANKQINLIINQNTLNEAKLPAWITLSKQIENSFLTERILKTGLVYHEVSGGNLFWRDLPSSNFDEPKKHDPLVVIATLLFNRPNLDEKERIKILKSMYNARHQAQDRLWSGDLLETVSVITNVKLSPEYRIAYTEKTLTVRNNARNKWSSQEAIYTFHLSQGSAVSSLSLWINGKEEKSRLSTKGKADSAYHQVVGVEVRDPSVVHWQEGNTIIVRIFPCTMDENRKFKIGITSPMSKQGNTLIYENAFFEGPDATKALETMQVTTTGNPGSLQLPVVFKEMAKGVYRADRTYLPDWEIACKAPALAPAAFSFDGSAYKVSDYQEIYEAFAPESIYLDLNNSWSEAEFRQLWPVIKDRAVYVVNEGSLLTNGTDIIQLNEQNFMEIYQRMHEQNFSLFPISAIKAPDKALIISKSTSSSPNLNDLEDCEFGKELSAYCQTPKHIRFYNIGYQLSPYLKALKEFRVFNYTHGNIANLHQLIAKQQFIKDQEDSATVVIDNARLMIRKSAGSTTQNAPDHLLRLFAYNDIMKKVGTNFFTSSYVQPDLINEADQAFIVSPVSSLIVLETRKDYERFGIEESKNSLKNASMKSSGAVPEPQEWLLIVLGSCIVIYTLYAKRTTRSKV